MTEEPHDTAPDPDEWPDDHLGLCARLVELLGRTRLRNRIQQSLVDQPQRVRRRALKADFDVVCLQVLQELAQPPGSRQIQGRQPPRGDDDLMHSPEIDSGQGGIDSGKLQGAPFAGQL